MRRVPAPSRALTDLLARQGYRLTAARRAILAVFAASDRPLAVEEIRARLVRPTPDRVTVYRNIHLLVRAGLLRVAGMAREGVRYTLGEQIAGHHAFLVCQQCGRIDTSAGCPLPDQALTRLRRQLARAHQFQLVDHEVRLLGLCRSCHA
jgi:Fur family transcriptional regulator, ferric uptake regulator